MCVYVYVCICACIVGLLYRMHACQLLAPTLTVNAHRDEGLVSCMRMNCLYIYKYLYVCEAVGSSGRLITGLA